ncbi:hypothetical protein UFOVP1279_18 [uncultured Caudovirales phage]|uniref:Collagen triple helix repeat n=1 Tax=uncultured Caudovirales phage TaxID=2100421 RepID=A0A6J5RMY7_9CAUD|nr:hypothetical protein UFOVP1279_18 [uncultured Caudovirales phage]
MANEWTINENVISTWTVTGEPLVTWDVVTNMETGTQGPPGADGADGADGTGSFSAAVVLLVPSLTPASGDTIYLMQYVPNAPGSLAVDSGNEYDCPVNWEITISYINSDLWVEDPNQHVLLMFPGDLMPTVYALVHAVDFEPVEVLGGQVVSVGCGGAGLFTPALWVGSNAGAGLGGFIDPLVAATSFIPHSVTSKEVQIATWTGFTGTLSTITSSDTLADALEIVDGFDLTGTQGDPGPQGDPGAQGDPGPQGDPGVPALWNFTGAYSSGDAYAVGDVATFGGQTWYRIDANGGTVGNAPAEGTFWTLIAAEGIQGDPGAQGDPGIQGDPGSPGADGDQWATTSTSTLTISAGTKTLTVEADLSWTPGQSVIIAYDAGHHIHGTVTSYSGTTLVVEHDKHTGSGTYSVWSVNLDGAIGATLGVGLIAIDGLTPAANRLPYFTGATTADLATFTAAGRALVAGDLNSDQRTTLGLGGAAVLDVGTVSGTVVAGNDVRLTSFPLLASAQYTASTSLTSTAAALTNNRLYYVPFLVTVSTTFDRIAINHTATAASAGSVARLGIYNSASGVPSTRVLDAGTVDLTTAAALKPITISQTLAPGIYWLAAVAQFTGSPTFATAPPSIAVPSDTSTATGTKFEAGVTGTLPATATPGATNTTQPPVLYLRKA